MSKKRSKPKSKARRTVSHVPKWLSSPELSPDGILNILPLWEAKAMERLHGPPVSSDTDFGDMTEALCIAAEARGIDSGPINGFELLPDVDGFREAAKAVHRLETKAKREVKARIEKKTGRGNRMSKEEANTRARDILKEDPNATSRKLAKKICCSTGLVSSLPAWKAVMEQRRKGRKPKTPEAVPLTEKVLATVGQEDEALKQLINEQEADKRESEAMRPRFRPRRTP